MPLDGAEPSVPERSASKTRGFIGGEALQLPGVPEFQQIYRGDRLCDRLPPRPHSPKTETISGNRWEQCRGCRGGMMATNVG